MNTSYKVISVSAPHRIIYTVYGLKSQDHAVLGFNRGVKISIHEMKLQRSRFRIAAHLFLESSD